MVYAFIVMKREGFPQTTDLAAYLYNNRLAVLISWNLYPLLNGESIP